MTERITNAMLRGKFESWTRAINGRVAVRFDDVGGYILKSNAPGDGIRRYEIQQVTSKGGGVRQIGRIALGAREMWELLHAGIVAIEERHVA